MAINAGRTIPVPRCKNPGVIAVKRIFVLLGMAGPALWIPFHLESAAVVRRNFRVGICLDIGVTARARHCLMHGSIQGLEIHSEGQDFSARQFDTQSLSGVTAPAGRVHTLFRTNHSIKKYQQQQQTGQLLFIEPQEETAGPRYTQHHVPSKRSYRSQAFIYSILRLLVYQITPVPHLPFHVSPLRGFKKEPDIILRKRDVIVLIYLF